MRRRFRELRFWTFVRRRQQAWAAKHGLCPAPEDPVLRKAKFTNVFRALDRGTLYAIHELIRPLEDAQRLWAVCIYRAMNRIDAFSGLFQFGRMPYKKFDPDAFLVEAAEWRAAGNKVFTGVYQSTRTFIGYAQPGAGTPMDRRLAAYADELAIASEWIADDLGNQVQDRADALRSIRPLAMRTRLGPFAAHQAMLDLDYHYMWRDDWVHVGPGAKAGLKLIYDPPYIGTALDFIERLRDTQPEIEHAPRDADGRPVRLQLPDVEHALCEYQKYVRIRAGGHMKGTYVPLSAGNWNCDPPLPPWWRMP